MSEKPDGRGNKERKRALEKSGEIDCGHCPFHKGDNVKRVGRPKPDRYKGKRKGLK